MTRRLACLTLLALLAHALPAPAQAPGVPVYDETRLNKADAAVKKAAVALQRAGGLLGMEEVAAQLDGRKKCKLQLPPPGKDKLPPR